MNISHEEKFVVKFHEVDFKGKVKLFTIMDYIQHTAEVHGTKLGFGYEAMMNHGLFWVVSRMKLNMYRYPSTGEEVIVETKLAGCEKLFCVRRFNIRDGIGNLLGEAMLYYIIVDIASKFPQKPKACPINIINLGNENKGSEQLKKIRMPEKVLDTMERKFYYNDIDANNHVNNARYVSFIEDCFPIDWHKDHEISSIQINYIKEIKAEDSLNLNIYTQDHEDKTCFINGTNKEENSQEFFQCKLQYK